MHLARRRPGAPEQRLQRGCHLEVGPLTGPLRYGTAVEAVPGELDQRVGQAAIPVAVVIGTSLLRQWLKRGPQHSSTRRIEQTANEDKAVLGGVELERTVLHAASLVGGIGVRVAGVPGVMAGMAEASHRKLGGAGQKGGLVEGVRGRRLMKGAGGASQEGEVGKADAPLLHSLDALGQAPSLLPYADPLGSGVTGHPALVADPADGGYRALEVKFVGGSESGSGQRELQLQHVADAAQLDQLLGQLRGGQAALRTFAKGADGG